MGKEFWADLDSAKELEFDSGEKHEEKVKFDCIGIPPEDRGGVSGNWLHLIEYSSYKRIKEELAEIRDTVERWMSKNEKSLKKNKSLEQMELLDRCVPGYIKVLEKQAEEKAAKEIHD